MKVGDLVIAKRGSNLFYGFGVITAIDPDWLSKTIKIYWFESKEHNWEQRYHIEAYCNKLEVKNEDR